MTDERDPIRMGIVGTGAISQVVHVPIFAERHDVDLVALSDADVHKAEALSRRFSVPLVMDTSELIAVDDLDAVVICTPNDVHEQIAIDALEAGKHVFVERPLALSAEGASRVLRAAESSGRVLSVGMPHRFRPNPSGPGSNRRHRYIADSASLRTHRSLSAVASWCPRNRCPH